jgi:hypothetical protein
MATKYIVTELERLMFFRMSKYCTDEIGSRGEYLLLSDTIIRHLGSRHLSHKRSEKSVSYT